RPRTGASGESSPCRFLQSSFQWRQQSVNDLSDRFRSAVFRMIRSLRVMSPFLLRRYRAERLLREEFETLRERVLAAVEGRLAGAGGRLDRSDLEAAYAQAWQGLYAAVLEGREIASPGAWLAVVTNRRAVDERRARRGVVPVPFGCEEEHSQLPGREPDLIDRLDDRARMRTLLEALRARLSERERQAAA